MMMREFYRGSRRGVTESILRIVVGGEGISNYRDMRYRLFSFKNDDFKNGLF